ncbi:hypothetical protein MVEN_00351700 [Mycena venus]|uniref:Uncharacterized protein n=1 Tax=Mycena venus TaxID=2733690 RepID=A0A8H6YU24_9AGAR|nr:hypothetical protein MVEN_00351700 [Mycena venus]
MSVPGSSTASSPNRTPSGFDFTAPIESRGRKRKIESVYSISPSPLTSDSEDDSSGKGSMRERHASRPNPRPIQSATPDGRGFTYDGGILRHSRRAALPPLVKTPRKASASETASPRKVVKSPIVPLHHYKLYAISSSPSTNPFDPTNPTMSIPPFHNWRHPDELEYIGPNHPSAAQWTDIRIVTFMVDNAFTILSRNADSKQTWVEVKVPNRNGTVTSTTLPRGYRIPLLWLGKVEWDCLKLLLTSAKEQWPALRFDVLHIARLSFEFLAKARKEVKMKRGYRDVMFDRALSRFFNGWMGSRDEFVWDFYREFRDEEYEDDMLQRRWLQKAVKGIQGFAITERELSDGITAEQFTRGLNLDREKGTFEWIDPDAAEPAATTSAPPPVPAIEAAPVPAMDTAPASTPQPSPLRVEVAPSPLRSNSPLSLSQVAGVHSSSPSPLTPEFGIDQLMDVDPPQQPQQSSRTQAPAIVDTSSGPQAEASPSENELDATLPKRNRSIAQRASHTRYQVSRSNGPQSKQAQASQSVEESVDSDDDGMDSPPRPPQKAPTHPRLEVEVLIDRAPKAALASTSAESSVAVNDAAKPPAAQEPTSAESLAVNDAAEPLEACEPTSYAVQSASDSAARLDAAPLNVSEPTPTPLGTAAVEEMSTHVDDGLPPPRRWTSPLSWGTPAGEEHGDGARAEDVPMDVVDGANPVVTPLPSLDLDRQVFNGDSNASDKMHDMDDLDELEADFLRYPPSNSGSRSPPPPKAEADSAIQNPFLLGPQPHPNGILGPTPPLIQAPQAQEEDELEFDETDYLRSRLPSPFAATPPSQPLQLESFKPGAMSPLAEPPVELTAAGLSSRATSPQSESIRSSSSPEARLPELPEEQHGEQSHASSVPPEAETGAAEGHPSPPPDSDEEEGLVQEPAQVDEPTAVDESPQVDEPAAIDRPTVENVEGATEEAHILPLSPADAADEFPPGFHFMGMPHGAPPRMAASARLCSLDQSSELVQVRPTAGASRTSASPPINDRAQSPVVIDVPLSTQLTPPTVTAETVLSALPQTGDSKRVKLEIMTVSLTSGDKNVIAVEDEEDMDIETPIDVDMEDRSLSPPAVSAPSRIASPPLSESQSLFTPDATPRSSVVTSTTAVGSAARTAAAATGASHLASPSISVGRASSSVPQQSNDDMVAPGLSSIGRSSHDANIFRRTPTPSHRSPTMAGPSQQRGSPTMAGPPSAARHGETPRPPCTKYVERERLADRVLHERWFSSLLAR